MDFNVYLIQTSCNGFKHIAGFAKEGDAMDFRDQRATVLLGPEILITVKGTLVAADQRSEKKKS